MKQKKAFEIPFLGTSVVDGVTLLYSNSGNFSTVLEIENMALQYSADSRNYEDFHLLLGQCIKILGANFILQKTDIISKRNYARPEQIKESDYLQKKYFEHFEGRSYNSLSTFLTITLQNNRGRFFSYDLKEIKNFLNHVFKVMDAFKNYKLNIRILNEHELDKLHDRFLAFNFHNDKFPICNISCDDEGLYFGSKTLKVISLIDIDELNIPGNISTYSSSLEAGRNFPSDNFSFLLSIPGCETILYNQVITIPDQMKIKRELEIKKKRHISMPDAANQLSVDDIDDMFIDIAKDNELLTYAHFSFLVFGEGNKINKATNYIDSQLFAIGIIPGRNTYNQMELFRCAIPGNADELKKYDKFLTSRPAAVSFLFKESLPKTELSDYLLYFTDRQGVPIGIDTSELPMQINRIQNRNKFVLGPSGSGKSFFTNSYVKQCKSLGADIILVDTGHSYSGLCKYFDGKYITYQEDKPITMNPFNIEEVENNEEKRQILKSLIGLLWKGIDGTLSQIEDTIINKVVSDYYLDYFGVKKQVHALCFNSFYEFSLVRIKAIMMKENISFNLDEFRFVLQKFYKGGEYEKILNDEFDDTLFNAGFIVFEIDSIKEHKMLFPITTLIIMDVFIQKMRYKKNKKILIIEEAWKAIASPMMASYILYLYKTVRKFAGEAIIVTQELDDIVGNSIVKNSIIANSDTICLLDQSRFKDNFDDISKLLSLNEVEKSKIFTINRLDNKENRARFKEVYIKRGSTGEVYGVEVPLEEYLTYTTERSEKDAIAIYFKKYPSYVIAIDTMVNDFKNSGKDWLSFIKQINSTNLVYNPLNLIEI